MKKNKRLFFVKYQFCGRKIKVLDNGLHVKKCPRCGAEISRFDWENLNNT